MSIHPATNEAMPGATPVLPSLRNHRLRKHADYQAVYKSSRRQHARQIAYFWSGRTNTPHTAGAAGPRIGLTVPKAMAPKAVDRNRIKRRVREAIRSALPLLSADVDLVLHPRRTVLTLDFDTLQREVAQIFRSVESASARTSASKLRPATNPIP